MIAPPGRPKTSVTPRFSSERRIAPDPVRISGSAALLIGDVGTATVLVVRGERALSGAAIAAIDSAMNDVGVAERAMCGADKPLLSLDVTSASQGTKRFADGFYSCLGGDAVYVDRVDAVFAALDALTVAAD